MEIMRIKAHTGQRAQLPAMAKIFISILIIGGLAGCAKSASSTTTPANSYTYISVMNLAPYSPSALVFLNNVQATPVINPGDYSLAYGHLAPAIYDVKFKVNGQDSTLATIPAASYDSTHYYTLILYNDSINGPARALKINDDFSNLTISSSYIRFLHMCLELPTVDLYMNNTPVQQNRNAKDIVPNETFSKFQSMTPGVYNLQIKKAGTDSLLGYLNNVNLQAGNAYTIFLSGSKTNSQNPVSLNVLQAIDN